MAYVRLTVDGKTEIDAELGAWTAQPPSVLRDLIKPGAAPPAPSMKCVMIALADAELLGQNVDIALTTGPDSWVLAVKALP